AIRAAVVAALNEGVNLSGHTALEEALGRIICERFPSIELVRFTNSGTEANLMALAAATSFTRRRRIIVFDGAYHGGVLSFAGGGSPINVPHEFVVSTYNDVDQTLKLIEENRGQLAAILVEPMIGSGGSIPADVEFLQALRRAATESGALLIFDEVMTSRLAPGGRQQAVGIMPDLCTLGKYLGGGMSFGAFGGRRDVMAQFDPRRPGALPHAGTFNNNVVTMAAGIAGLTRVFTPAAAEALNARGDALRGRLNALCRDRGASFQFTGIGSLMSAHATARSKGCFSSTCSRAASILPARASSPCRCRSATPRSIISSTRLPTFSIRGRTSSSNGQRHDARASGYTGWRQRRHSRVGAPGSRRLADGVDLHVGGRDAELLHYRSPPRDLAEQPFQGRRGATRAAGGARPAALPVVGAESAVLPAVERRATRVRRRCALAARPLAATAPDLCRACGTRRRRHARHRRCHGGVADAGDRRARPQPRLRAARSGAGGHAALLGAARRLHVARDVQAAHRRGRRVVDRAREAGRRGAAAWKRCRAPVHGRRARLMISSTTCVLASA